MSSKLSLMATRALVVASVAALLLPASALEVGRPALPRSRICRASIRAQEDAPAPEDDPFHDDADWEASIDATSGGGVIVSRGVLRSFLKLISSLLAASLGCKLAPRTASRSIARNLNIGPLFLSDKHLDNQILHLWA